MVVDTGFFQEFSVRIPRGFGRYLLGCTLCIVCWLFVLSSKYSSAILRLLSAGKYCMFFYSDDSLPHWRLCCLPGNVCSENDFVSNLLQPEFVLVPI